MVDSVAQFDDDINVFIHLPNIAIEAHGTVPGAGDLATQVLTRLR